MEIILGFLGNLDRANVITSVLVTGKQVGQSQKRCDDRSRGWSDAP